MSRHDMPGVVRPEKNFRWRAAEVSRLEGFSDAVFAFAVTLLVVSLEVPSTFEELMAVMRGFPAFGLCFVILAHLWYSHVLFFRRYGLQTPYASALSCAVLFCVLFYVYPLKFLFTNLLNVHSALESGAGFSALQGRTLFTIYGLGYAAISLVFVLLYLHAWKLRHALGLDESENLLTRASLIDHAALGVIGCISTVLAWALPANLLGLAGYFYFILGVYFSVSGRMVGARLNRLERREGPATS